MFHKYILSTDPSSQGHPYFSTLLNSKAAAPKNVGTAALLPGPGFGYAPAFELAGSAFQLPLSDSVGCLCVSFVSANKRFGLFLPCAMFSEPIVHLTQGWHLPAQSRNEDVWLAPRVSQQSDTALGKRFQAFLFFNVTSASVSVHFLSGSKRRTIAQPSTLSHFFNCLMKMHGI